MQAADQTRPLPVKTKLRKRELPQRWDGFVVHPTLHGSYSVVRMVVPIVIVVILMGPIAIVDVPSIGVVVVVWVRIIGAGIGRTLPSSRSPYPSSVFGNPVSIDPCVARARNWWTSFVSIGRRWFSNCDAEGNLR